MEGNVGKTFKKNGFSVKRSQAEITTVCCSDGGDNRLWGKQSRLSEPRITSSLLHLEPRAAQQKSLTSFKGGLPEVRKRSHAGRSREVHNTIKTSHLIACMLDFLGFWSLFIFS